MVSPVLLVVAFLGPTKMMVKMPTIAVIKMVPIVFVKTFMSTYLAVLSIILPLSIICYAN